MKIFDTFETLVIIYKYFIITGINQKSTNEPNTAKTTAEHPIFNVPNPEGSRRTEPSAT